MGAASRRRPRPRVLVLTLAVLAPAAGAGADAFLLDDQRSLSVRNDTCTSPCPVELTKTPFLPGAPFSDIISGPLFADWSSSQSSSFAGDELAGIGFTDAFTSLGEGRSRYDVTFSLDGDHAFELSGALEAEGNGGALALLSDEDSQLPVFVYAAGPLAGGPLHLPLAETGVLPPGQYRLQVEGVVVPSLAQGGDADWSFTLALPEPEVAWQLAAGIVALVALRRRRPQPLPSRSPPRAETLGPYPETRQPAD